MFMYPFYVNNNDSNYWKKQYFDQKQKNISQKSTTTAAEIFLASIFDLKRTCQVVPTENV